MPKKKQPRKKGTVESIGVAQPKVEMTNKEGMVNKRKIRFFNGEQCEGLEMRLSFDQEKMKSKNEYYFYGQRCPIVKLDSQLADSIAGLGLIKKDLKFVKKAIHLILKKSQGHMNTVEGKFCYRDEVDEESDVLKGLYISFVITYGKAFTEAAGRGVMLDAKDIFKNAPSKELRESHDDLMDQRNNYIAHGGKTDLEDGRTILVLAPNQHPDSKPAIIADTVHTNCLFGEEGLSSYLNLVDYVDSELKKKFDKRCEKLTQVEIERIPVEDWYKKAAY